jgi:chorismate mutase/prephenate dehydratase
MEELEAVRRRIDEVDDSLLELLERRAELAEQAARVKGGTQRDEDRERAIVARLKLRARRIPRRAVNEAWTTILAACRVAQQRAAGG